MFVAKTHSLPQRRPLSPLSTIRLMSIFSTTASTTRSCRAKPSYPRSTGDERHPLIRLTAPKLSPLHQAGEELPSVLKAARDSIMANVLHADVDAPIGGELRDSTSHHAGPQHRKVL